MEAVRPLMFSSPIAAILALALCHGSILQALRAQDPEFLANAGQWPAAVRHYVRHGGLQTWLHDGGFTTRAEEFATAPDPGRPGRHRPEPPVHGVVLRTTLVGSLGPMAVAEQEPGSARYHFYHGADPTRWVTSRSGYRRLVHEQMLPGLDLVLRSQDGVVHYDVRLAPAASVALAQFRVEGHDRLELADDGALLVHTGLGALRHSMPLAFELLPDGQRRSVSCRFELLAADRFGFAVSDRDDRLPLLIDPGITWSRLLGSTGNDFPGFPDSIEVASNGDLLVCGNFAAGTAFPQTPGAYNNAGSVRDGFLSRLSATGALVWSAHIGGNNIDRINGVEELTGGDVVICGFTRSSTWPVTPGAMQTQFGGGPTPEDGFLTRLTGNGATLLFSTYVGGSGDEELFSVAQLPGGLIATCGYTDSTDFPVAGNPFQPARATSTCTANYDGVVAVFDPAGTMVAGTYCGGGCEDWFQFLDVDGTDLVVSGGTSSVDFPVTPNAFQPQNAGGAYDGCIARFDSLLTTQLYGTYFGGSNSEDARIAVDRGGRIAVGGWTSSAGLPTTPGAPQLARQGAQDGFVGVLDLTLPPAQQLAFLTYLGGWVADEGVNGIAVEPSGLITVCGSVASPNFPTTAGAYRTTFQGGGWDAFVTRLDPWPAAAQRIVYSSFVGGSASFDYAYGLALLPDGSAALAVNAGSVNYPTTMPPAFGGGTNDAAVTVLDMLPANVFRYGAPSPPCHGPLHLSVNGYPQTGSTTFEFHANQAPPNSFGMLYLSSVATAPIPVLGIDVWIGVPPPPGLAAISDARGFARFPLPIPFPFVWPFGGFQSAWLPLSGCAPIVASDAIR